MRRRLDGCTDQPAVPLLLMHPCLPPWIQAIMVVVMMVVMGRNRGHDVGVSPKVTRDQATTITTIATNTTSTTTTTTTTPTATTTATTTYPESLQRAFLDVARGSAVQPLRYNPKRPLTSTQPQYQHDHEDECDRMRRRTMKMRRRAGSVRGGG